MMAKLKLYDTSIPSEQVVRERDAAYLALSSKEKFLQLLALIRLSISLNGGRPLKQPQGKGPVISRNKIS
jgi:hypothetical protein